MFIGHGLLAFAIAASVAAMFGWDARRATLVGLVAAAFATLPDVDIAYAGVGLINDFDGLLTIDDVFWDGANVAHRDVTHALTVALVSSLGFAGLVWRGWRHPSSIVAAGMLLSLVVIAGTIGGSIAGAIVALFVFAGGLIAGVADLEGFGARSIGLAAALGLVTHPFGDFFTGTPPALLWPFDPPVDLGLVALHPDPTLHLLGAFFIELGIIWLAVLVYASVNGWSVLPAVSPVSSLGVSYGGAVFLIPAPTIHVAAPFVLSVLAVGLLALPIGRGEDVPARWRVPLTGLTAVTVAALSYTAVYLVL